jgi:RNA polymerase sigma factor (sigma-70 family)
MIGTFVPQPASPVMTDVPDDSRRPQPDPSGATPALSSIELLVRIKGGDDQALEALCARYLPRIKRWAHGRLPASSRGMLDTEDLAQEILTRALGHVQTFEPRHDGAFQGYVRKMLMNRVNDEARKGKRRPAAAPLEDQHQASEPSPLEIAIGREALARYDAALGRLKPLDRDLVIARLELGFSAAEIAAEFGKNTDAAAQMAVSRALVRLAKEMANV